MALTLPFFGKRQTTSIIRTVGQKDTIFALDALVKENYTGAAESTQHPVENGADVTDHFIIRPKGLQVSGIVTKTPFEGLADLIKAAGATAGSMVGAQLGRWAPAKKALGKATTAVGGTAGALLGAGVTSLATSLFSKSNDRLMSVVTELEKIRDARQPVDIQTGLKKYENYALASFTVSRSQSTGGSINVDLDFKEFIIAESMTTSVGIPKVKGALSAQNAGRKNLDSLSNDQNARGASLLKKIFGG